MAYAIWLTHPAAMISAICDYNNGTDIDEAAGEVLASLYTDDTFNEYSDNELQAAISEAMTEY